MRSGEGIWARKSEPSHAVLDQNQPDIPSQVGKALSVQGFVPAKIDPLIQLGIAVEDLTRPEFWILRRGRLLAGGLAIPAVVGQSGYFWLRGADGILAVVERIEIFNKNAANLSVGIFTAATASGVGGAPGRAYARDSRNGFVPATATGIAGGNMVGPTVPAFYVRALIGPGQLWVSSQPWVLASSGAYLNIVNDAALNQLLDVNIYYRERTLLDSEVP